MLSEAAALRRRIAARARMRAYRATLKGKAYDAKYQALPASKLRHKKYKASERGKRKIRDAQLKRYYGLSELDYLKRFVAQMGGCRICFSENPDGSSLHVDHDHQTKKVRGLLCFHCNTMLGHAKDNATILRRAALYLEGFSSCVAPFAGLLA